MYECNEILNEEHRKEEMLMKKKLWKMLFLVLMVCFMTACGSSEKKDDVENESVGNESHVENTNAENEAYVGTWVRETWVNDAGAVIDVTLELYADGTYKEETNHSINGKSVVVGDWTLRSNLHIIELCPKRLVEGYNDGLFYENGEYHGIVGEGLTSPGTTVYILDETTLGNTAEGQIKYYKQ